MIKKNILITGGAGYIGSHLANYLNTRKNRVYVIDDLSSGSQKRLNKKIFFRKLCISEKKKIRNLIIEKNITEIIHLAGKINAQESQLKRNEYFSNNYLYSKKLYETAKETNVKKFVFASTAAVYGDYKTLFKENDKKKPINNYGASKLKFEEYLSDNKKLNTVILRFFNVTGKFYIKENKINKNDSVILKIFKTFQTKKKSFYISTNTKKKSTRRDFIHIDDLIKIIEKTLSFKRKFLVLNCGYGKSVSILEILEEFEKIHNYKFNKIYKIKKKSDPFEVIADNSKLKKMFHFKAKYNSKKKILDNIKSSI